MSYGRLTYDATFRIWRVADLLPHVAIAFKRLFPKVALTETDIRLADIDSTRADLHWFMQRYPLEHDEAGRLQEGVTRLADKAAARGRILLPDWTPPLSAGFHEGKAPYLYQMQAAHITHTNPNLLLGDDVGLGKTISAIATLTAGAPLPAAIVVQPHLAGQWADRIAEFSTLRTHIIKVRVPYDLPSADCYIFRYSNVAGWVDVINKGLFRSVVYDEVQELRKGIDTEKGKAASVLSGFAELRQGLTATPIYNYGDEMFEVMQFIQPDLLGHKHEFMREWCGGHRVVRNPDALGTYLRDTGYFLRRTEHDETVATSMPPLNVVDWEVGYDQDAANAVDEIAKVLAQTVLSGRFVERGQAARELDMRMRMQTGIAKARFVAAYVDMLLKDVPRVLLAGWHRDVYDIWMRDLAAHKPILYTGSETAARKRKNVEEFTKGDARVMLISLRSGSGLDGLQQYCSDVVVGELDWSPQVHKQLFGRLRRPGQTRQVTAHYLHTAYGSDPVILDVLGLKTDQSRGIIDPMKGAEPRVRDMSRMERLAREVLAS